VACAAAADRWPREAAPAAVGRCSIPEPAVQRLGATLAKFDGRSLVVGVELSTYH
jgi:hypothetical protein